LIGPVVFYKKYNYAKKLTAQAGKEKAKESVVVSFYHHILPYHRLNIKNCQESHAQITSKLLF
jgi:hypothetical protein